MAIRGMLSWSKRFGIRDPDCEIDTVFGNRDRRARIPEMVAAGRNDRGDLVGMARNGQPFLVNIFVCGFGSTPSVIYPGGNGGHDA